VTRAQRRYDRPRPRRTPRLDSICFWQLQSLSAILPGRHSSISPVRVWNERQKHCQQRALFCFTTATTFTTCFLSVQHCLQRSILVQQFCLRVELCIAPARLESHRSVLPLFPSLRAFTVPRAKHAYETRISQHPLSAQTNFTSRVGPVCTRGCPLLTGPRLHPTDLTLEANND